MDFDWTVNFVFLFLLGPFFFWGIQNSVGAFSRLVYFIWCMLFDFTKAGRLAWATVLLAIWRLIAFKSFVWISNWVLVVIARDLNVHIAINFFNRWSDRWRLETIFVWTGGPQTLLPLQKRFVVNHNYWLALFSFLSLPSLLRTLLWNL